LSKRLKSCSLLALAASGLLLSSAPASAAAFYSGGATLPFGVYLRWFQELNGLTDLTSCDPATQTCVAYAPVGSGAGVTAFINQQSPNAQPSDTPYESTFIPYAEGVNGYGTGREFWDFSGSDAVLTTAQISSYNSSTAALRGPALQVPGVGSPVAIPYNTTGLTFPALRVVPSGSKTTVGGSGKLYLSRKAYCGIFTGAITNWNDPILTADNRGTTLASKPIKVVVRQESSGTTFLFSRHLDTVCDGSAAVGGFDWTGGVGTTVTWPSTFIKATGSNGVATTVRDTDGAIGYVSADYTQQAVSPEISPAPVAANLQTRASFEANQTPAVVKPIPPAPTYTVNALSSFVVPKTGSVTNPDPAAWSAALDSTALRNPANTSATTDNESYPISGFTMLNFYSCYFPATETSTIRSFVTGYTTINPTGNYDVAAKNRGFAPLPDAVKTAVRDVTIPASGTLGIHTGPISNVCTISSGS
jgi:ABC-type phosphate transport system substrate-binding protein